MMMKPAPVFLCLSLFWACPAVSAETVDATVPFLVAQAGCGSAAAQAEAQTGGSVIGAPKLVDKGGQKVCVVTVLIKDPDGKKPPSRKNVTIPAN